jgi:superfamily II DNA or RNA helicase
MKLYDYQKKYIADLPSSCIMAADTGTGKTVMALAHAKKLPLLIIAPASKVRTGDWEREAEAFGINTDRITVISYERATRTKSIERQVVGKERRYWWQDYIAEHKEFVLIADEVHKAKNSQSLVGKGIYSLARLSSQFIGLSATPLPNGWQDVCNYGKIFGWWRNKTEFFRDYVITYHIPNQHWAKITGYKQEDKLKYLWGKVAKPLKKSEALDLPKLSYQVIQTTRPKLYDQVLKTRIYHAEELDNAPKFTNALRRTIIAPRINWLEDFLEGASGHTVVFYNYIEEREAVLKIIPNGVTVYRQDGEKHNIPLKPDWSNMPERSITLAHYKSGGTGVEMTYADKIVYLSPTYSYADFSQSLGRVYRHGQNMPVTAYLLHTKQSIDASIWACIRQKRQFDIELWFDNYNKNKA